MQTISVKELERYAAKGSCLIIDLRSAEEYARGHVPGALNAPRGNIKKDLLNRKDQNIILYCDRGGLSMRVARELEKKGYHTKSVVGGYKAYTRGNMW